MAPLRGRLDGVVFRVRSADTNDFFVSGLFLVFFFRTLSVRTKGRIAHRVCLNAESSTCLLRYGLLLVDFARIVSALQKLPHRLSLRRYKTEVRHSAGGLAIQRQPVYL